MKVFDNDDLGKLILRLMVGGLMIFHGIAKIMNGTGFIEKMLTGAGLPAEIAYGIYVGEVLAPILIILGIQVRLSAITVIIAMLGAIYLVHMDELLTLTKHGAWSIETPMMFLMGSLALVFLGAGKYVVGSRNKAKA